jgi:hypothetical protein
MPPVTGHRGVSRGAAATTLAWPWARAAPRETPRCPVSQENVASSHFASAPPPTFFLIFFGAIGSFCTEARFRRGPG